METLPLKKARIYAEKIVQWINPYCERIEIAGSVRRECPECRDIDVVCVPRIRKGQNILRSALYDYVQKSDGRAHWRDPTLGLGCYGTGPYSDDKLLLFLPKCRLDVFCATEETFIGYLIRATGSSNHIFHLDQNSRKAHNFFSLENELFIQRQKVTPKTEQEFYALLGMEWVKPSERI